MAAYIGSKEYFRDEPKYLRARFYQQTDAETWHAVEAVRCSDFYADKIAYEQEQAEKYGEENVDMWFTKNFNYKALLWICPNTTSIQVSNVSKKLYVQVYSCSESKHLDEKEGGMTTYVDDQDEVCEDEGVIPDNLTKFWVTTMLP